MIGRMAACAAVVALCAMPGLSVPATAAEPWPVRPVKIVVPFSAAGTADLLSRVVAEKLSAAFGQAFVVEHRPGAGGMIGQEAVARAAPDGYTFVVSSLGSFIINPVFTPVPFDPFKDFTHIAYLGGQPMVLVGNKSLQQKTLAEVVEFARGNPGTFTYASIATGSHTQLLNEMLQKQSGVRMTHIPYRGANQIMTDVLGGHIAAGAVALQVASGQLASGAVRGLAISTQERMRAYPELPTYKEQGYPDLIASTWFALSGPAHLPPEIVERLNAEVVKALNGPDLQARFEREAIDTKTATAAEFTALFKAEAARWTPLAKAVAAAVKAAGGLPQ
jgi:tripartite-type tricarboxylate transporter receptor subunit TctC